MFTLYQFSTNLKYKLLGITNTLFSHTKVILMRLRLRRVNTYYPRYRPPHGGSVSKQTP